jgi:prepilin-type N-terminal cleavage/methylation domain-containing protein
MDVFSRISYMPSERTTINNHNGFTLIEVIVALAIIAVTMTGVALLMAKATRMKQTSDSLVAIKKVEAALEITYREGIAYVESNCAGWGDAGCSDGTVTPSNTDDTTLSVYLPTQNAQNAWTAAGCILSGSSPTFSVACPSGYGTKFTFSNVVNTQGLGALYLNGYNKQSYSITIGVTIPGGSSIVQDTWTSGYLDAEYFSRSNQKILTLLRAIKAYHFNRLLYEGNTNICVVGVGGLASTDDALVPWVWELVGSAPQQKCSGAEAGPCGCSGFTTSVWSNSASYLQIASAAALNQLVNNLGIDLTNRTDGYANMLTIRLITDSAGNTLAAPPSRPKPIYADCLPGGTGVGCSGGGAWTQLPPYSGVAGILSGGSMVYSQKIVYAN